MNDPFQSLSDATAAAVATAGASLVRVDARRRSAASGIVWTADGLILTADHVLVREGAVKVALPDGSELPAEIVGRDPTTDLALLRVQASGLTVPAWAEPEQIAVGQLVLALGRPRHSVQATLGVVSAWGGPWRTGAGGQVERLLRTDVLMYPGFSGGPLVGAGGRVLGLNSSALSRGASAALPLPTLRRVADELLAHGHIRRGYLGVSGQIVRLPEARAEALGQATGLLLVAVEPGGPAAQAGLAMGDTLLRLGGEPLRHMDDLAAALGGERIGTELPLAFLRGDELLERVVRIGLRG